MEAIAEKFRLDLLGPWRLIAPDGRRVEVTSRKGQALLALLAMAGNGERTRIWLQGMLWGSRSPEQAGASLRSELSALRHALNAHGELLLHSTRDRIWLDLARLDVDARASASAGGSGEFLEGFDIPGEEAFEDWLREERFRAVERQVSADIAPDRTAATPDRAPGAEPGFEALPALAVLPFANQTGDAGLDYLAEGLSEDMIDRLARLRWLPVIARSSSFAIRETGGDAVEAGRKLGARYVVEGRLRLSSGNRLLAIELIDCEAGKVVWSDKLAVGSAAQEPDFDELLNVLAATLDTRVDLEEQRRSLGKPQADLNVSELIWRGRWHFNRFTREDSRLAHACFAEALAREPSSPEALIQSVWAQTWDLWARRAEEAEIRALRQMAQKAIVSDCEDARGYMLAGVAELWLRQPLRARALLDRAIALNPSLVMAHAQMGAVLRVTDEPEAAIAAFQRAVRLSPNDHAMFFIDGEMAACELMLGRYAAALHHADLALSRRTAYWFGYVIKINALVRMDRQPEARQAYAELLQAKSGFDPAFIDWQPFTDRRHAQFLKDGLNLAAAGHD